MYLYKCASSNSAGPESDDDFLPMTICRNGRVGHQFTCMSRVGMSLRDWWRCKKEDWEHESSSSSSLMQRVGDHYNARERPQDLEMMMMMKIHAHFLAGHNKALFYISPYSLASKSITPPSCLAGPATMSWYRMMGRGSEIDWRPSRDHGSQRQRKGSLG